jgi:hypothetical protein
MVDPDICIGMGTLDSALGCRRIGTHDLNAKFMKCPAVLSHVIAADAGPLVDVENGLLVAVERHALRKACSTDYIGTLSLAKLKQLRSALVVAFDIDDDLDADILELT